MRRAILRRNINGGMDNVRKTRIFIEIMKSHDAHLYNNNNIRILLLKVYFHSRRPMIKLYKLPVTFIVVKNSNNKTVGTGKCILVRIEPSSYRVRIYMVLIT